MTAGKWIAGVGHFCRDSICTVENYPQEDGSTHILAIDDSQGGGAVATALVAAARLGTKTQAIANLGDDPNGDHILQGLAGEGVGTEGIRRIAGGRSSASWVMVDPVHATRTKFPYRDSLPPIEFDEVRRGLLSGAAVLHLDGTNWDNAMRAARLAKEAGVPVSLDGCSRQKDNNEKNLQLAALADILIMNAVYPFAVSGRTEREEAMRFMASLGEKKVVAMTGGAEGCWLWNGESAEHIPAFRVAAIDSTGAGDVFHGAFLSEWLRGTDVRSCLRFASAVSALKCLKLGGRAGIPSREETERFLAGQT